MSAAETSGNDAREARETTTENANAFRSNTYSAAYTAWTARRAYPRPQCALASS